jgi:vesicle-associated membrane protein 7
MRSIEYAAVLRGHSIIASIGDLSGLSEREILRLLPSSASRTEQKITLGKLFSFFLTPGLAFVCVSPQSNDRQRPLAFLDLLSRKWYSSFLNVSASAGEHALDELFASNFSDLFEEYGRPNRAAEVARELERTQQILAESVTKALGRGADLEAISTKGESLRGASEEFRNQAVNLKWKMRCQYFKSWMGWAVVVVLGAWVVASRLCGGWSLGSCF